MTMYGIGLTGTVIDKIIRQGNGIEKEAVFDCKNNKRIEQWKLKRFYYAIVRPPGPAS